MPSPLATALPALRACRDRLATRPLRRLFDEDPGRFQRFSLSEGDLLADFSKVRIDADAFVQLLAVADAAGVDAARDRMLAGEPINMTERRPVLHVALRAPRAARFDVAGCNVVTNVHAVLDAMAAFADGVRSGTIAGAPGRAFTDVVNIGIGGSDLGPRMVAHALAPFSREGPRLHFVANIDGADITDTLRGLDPGATLLIVASKTFTTDETMTNARTARRWIAETLGEAAVGAHFAAVSTAIDKVAAFGIAADRIFGFWDWVGGRYSVWSAIGLPVAIAIGPENFEKFLAGAHAMDRHFAQTPAPWNLPVILALIGVWHRNVCGYPTHAVLPYDQRLAQLPVYLQQLEMESNGKRVTLAGTPTETATCPVVWGAPGTNGQHAFFQLLHQGTEIVPADFLIAAEGQDDLPHHHDRLVANCLAQSEALMRGRTEAEAAATLRKAGLSEADVHRLAPHKAFPGDRPSLTLLYRRLDPATLGRLIALYEHKVFVQGILWGVNSFDQMGVELGKELATELLGVIRGDDLPADRDGSTAGLVHAVAAHRG